MIVPSFVKKQSGILFNALNEVDRKKVFKETFLPFISIKGSIVNDDQFSKTRNPNIKDTIAITIDINDVEEQYFRYTEYDQNGWTIHPDEDYLVVNGMELAIVGFNETMIVDKVRFIEITCKRK